MKNFVLLLLFSISLISCMVVNTTKATKGDTCSLHQVQMRKTMVSTTYGRACKSSNQEQYPNARADICMGCVVRPWPERRLALVYVCKQCDLVKQETLAAGL